MSHEDSIDRAGTKPAPEKPETLTDAQLDDVAGGTRATHDSEKTLRRRVSPKSEKSLRHDGGTNIRMPDTKGIRMP